ncbi:(2Fe-2S) ferredoxin domain-containing protein [Pendulispora albinea]|uniref:(2Fe-2S) ferredoxin domain-containing protein n=1 Tax=Pendulispora albinea TaxID=2741071 RepID=A0ABZ2M101_9BACT
MPQREHYLFVCTNRRDDANPRGSCAQKGSEELAKKLKSLLKSKGAARAVRACTSSCLDMCETGITILQEPEHVVYGHVTEDDLESIVEASARGEVVERLVVGGAGTKEAADSKNRQGP